MNKKDEARLKKNIESVVHYDAGTATSYRRRAKERFYRRLQEHSHLYDKEVVFGNNDLITQLAGTHKAVEWLRDEKFARWWWDEDIVRDSLMALREKSVGRLADILEDGDIAPGDALKAARMVFELTDQFPTKKQEVRFLDEELNKLEPGQVELETLALKKKLDTIEGDTI